MSTSSASTSPGPRWQVSVRNGREPFWRQDGREIYYHGPERTVMAVTVDTSGETPVLGRRGPPSLSCFAAGTCRYHFGALPDGQSFAMNVPRAGSAPAPMTFVINW